MPPARNIRRAAATRALATPTAAPLPSAPAAAAVPVHATLPSAEAYSGCESSVGGQDVRVEGLLSQEAFMDYLETQEALHNARFERLFHRMEENTAGVNAALVNLRTSQEQMRAEVNTIQAKVDRVLLDNRAIVNNNDIIHRDVHTVQDTLVGIERSNVSINARSRSGNNSTNSSRQNISRQLEEIQQQAAALHMDMEDIVVAQVDALKREVSRQTDKLLRLQTLQ